MSVSVEFAHIDKSFGTVQVLHDVSFALPTGLDTGALCASTSNLCGFGKLAPSGITGSPGRATR